MNTIQAVGIPWYRQEDWPALVSIFEDRHVLHDRFRDWRRAAEGLEKKFRKDGYIVERAYIDPREFPLWCAARGLNINAEARSAFANEVAYLKHRNQS